MEIDIILITYNQEQYIAHAVESILMQRVNDDVQVRVIVADDCSTDNTLHVIKSYENKSLFSFVYLSTPNNLGVARNYQRAFELCDGEYVAILEGDDWWCDTNRLQKHIDYLNTHMEICYTKNASWIYSQSHKTYTSCLYSDENITLLDVLYDNQLIGNLSSCVFRTKALHNLNDKVFVFSAEMGIGCDWFLGLDVLQYGCGYIFPEIMSVYRIDTSKNISRQKKTLDEELMECYIHNTKADIILNNRYNTHLAQVYRRKKNEIREYRMHLFYQKVEYYASPLVVEICKLFIRMWYLIKRLVKLLIPRVLYVMLNKKK